ncbi:P-loop containing nucleoside triphosphate hydrolase protein [Ochromonadaceae sp. CCMP2298]|nr:P-loop containing nucleoside triphosphate hydrolase protein [Ochromonadaceae sp. CCMP2298]
MLARRSTLPAFQMREEVLRAIEMHSVTVISGDTGCGKTTQVPQLVLDDFIEKGRGGECSILVTQPRRISAMSVSERIAKERVEPIGHSTGYHIRLETKKSSATRLLLLTTGELYHNPYHHTPYTTHIPIIPPPY